MKTTKHNSIQSRFRIIQGIMGLLLVFLLIQGFVLWGVCSNGTQAIQGLKEEGLPSLRHLASLQENLAIYRLHSYELMFAQEQNRAAKSKETDAVHQKNLEIIAALNRLYPDGQGHQHVAALEASLSDYVQTMGRIRSALDKDFADAMKVLDQDIPAKVERLNLATDKVKAYCSQVATARTDLTVSGFASIRQLVLWLGSANVGFAALVFGFVTFSSWNVRRALKGVVNSLSSIADSLVGSASLVSSSSQSLAGGASTQAASLQQTSASLEELSSMTRQNAENTQQAKNLAGQARQAAEKGARDMEQMNSAMGAIKTSSDDIAKIIKTIDEIAFQTNILALNAAVEAARAGEAGMGFAVVADEVRSLAQRSATAAKETAAKIEGAISKTDQGVGISAKVAQALNEIVAKARQLDELAAGVAQASRDQGQGITQINSEVAQMDGITQTNAASAEESAAAAEDLNGQANALKSAVSDLQTLVGSLTVPKATGDIGQAALAKGKPALRSPFKAFNRASPTPASFTTS